MTVLLPPWAPADRDGTPLVRLVVRAEREAIVALRGPRADREGDAPDLGAFARVRAALQRWLAPAVVDRTVTTVGERAGTAAHRHWSRQVSNAVGSNVLLPDVTTRGLVQAWIAENTARIGNLRDHALERIRADLETAALSGTRVEELAALWERDGIPTRNGRMVGRASVIARDQLGTLGAQIAEHQQRELGITHYRWDARPGVPRQRRAVHAGRHGAKYAWDAPPPGGHPGQPIQCHCRPRGVLDSATLRRLRQS